MSKKQDFKVSKEFINLWDRDQIKITILPPDPYGSYLNIFIDLEDGKILQEILPSQINKRVKVIYKDMEKGQVSEVNFPFSKHIKYVREEL